MRMSADAEKITNIFTNTDTSGARESCSVLSGEDISGSLEMILESKQEKKEGSNHEWTLIDTNATKGEQR